jgi:hypothetical protein
LQSNSLLPRRFRSSALSAPPVRVGLPTSHVAGKKRCTPHGVLDRGIRTVLISDVAITAPELLALAAARQDTAWASARS